MKRYLLVLLMFLLVSQPVYAQNENNTLEINTISPTPIPDVTYTLPYPGLLPDNPLYSLKATRDRIVSYLIVDPLKKAEFDLLQADKRLQAGLFLLHKENPNIPLAITTISKGQNYLHEAISGIEKAQKQSAKSNSVSPTGTAATTVGDLPDKLYTAARKHNELLQKENPKLSGQTKEDYELLLHRSKEFITAARKLQEQK